MAQSETTTPNYGLNQYSPTETLTWERFTEDNSLIDTALKNKTNFEDSGWIDFIAEGGATQSSPPLQYRSLNGVVYIRGIMLNITVGQVFATIPAAFRPSMTHWPITHAHPGVSPIVMSISSGGGLIIYDGTGVRADGVSYPLG